MKMRFWLPLQFTLYFVHFVAPRLSGFLLAPFENMSIKFFAISDECWKQYKNKVKDQRGLSLKTLSFKDVKQSLCRMVPRQIRGVFQKKTVFFGNFSQKGGGGHPISQNFFCNYHSHKNPLKTP